MESQGHASRSTLSDENVIEGRRPFQIIICDTTKGPCKLQPHSYCYYSCYIITNCNLTNKKHTSYDQGRLGWYEERCSVKSKEITLRAGFDPIGFQVQRLNN
ncbi:unnamed protein product [Owenia fusiformis]|uniref:Uncharacterized protein n=1 Tax=Owenia fusiformis TaxID=6347 RepID=A0A8S4PBG0_OWEFU|nr:unnamed protein product [Owenia fusiformis]